MSWNQKGVKFSPIDQTGDLQNLESCASRDLTINELWVSDNSLTELICDSLSIEIISRAGCQFSGNDRSMLPAKFPILALSKASKPKVYLGKSFNHWSYLSSRITKHDEKEPERQGSLFKSAMIGYW